MRSNYYILFAFIFYINLLYSQSTEYKLINTEVIETGNYGDSIVRKITALENGAEFRFIHPNVGNALWHIDSLILYIVNKNKLTRNSSDFEVVFAAADFIKRSGIESHINDIEWFLPTKNYDEQSQNILNINTLKHPLSFTSIPSKICGEFNHQLHNLVELITKKIAKTRIHVRGVSLIGHQTNEYWDRQFKKWVYVDADPQSEVFIPRKMREPVSIEEIINDKSILQDTTSFFHEKLYGQIDSLSIFHAISETQKYINSINDVNFYTFKRLNINTYPNNIYYKLLPNQELFWDYSISSLFLEKFMFSNDCSKNLFLELKDFFENDTLIENLDSAMIINHALKITGQIARCYKKDSIITSLTILRERLTFSDSTHYGKNIYKEHTFTTTLPPGKYTTNDIFIPNIIKDIKGGPIVFENKVKLKDGFYWIEKEKNYDADVGDYFGKSTLHTLTQNFVLYEETTITFLGNYRIQLVPSIAVFNGELKVENYVNGVLK